MTPKLGLVLMTALPPTEGHLALCQFAANYMSNCGGTVLALMCVLPDEPPGRGLHRQCLEEALREEGVSPNLVRVEVQFSNDPQGPTGPDDDKFWAHWMKVVLRQTGEEVTHVFSSEEYGYRLAESLQAVHVPFSPDRSVVPCSATSVRRDPVVRFDQIVAPLRRRLMRRITMFGQESVGKTTTGRHLATRLNSVFSPEWARPYLESLTTPAVSVERMQVIAEGQAAQEAAALARARRSASPFLVQDTDLLSTIGYQELYFGRHRERHADADEYYRTLKRMEHLFRPADLYLLMSDEVPFKPNPLRYGGDKRETTQAYWVALLERYGCKYEIVRGDDYNMRLSTASVKAMENFNENCGFHCYERRR